MAIIKFKRIYELVEKTDGFRILVDRLWPRGMKKEDANFEVWMKEVAPSAGLRKWFNHDTKKWKAFVKKYHLELNLSSDVESLLELVNTHKMVTLIYSAKDEKHNQAVALKMFIDDILQGHTFSK